MPKNRTYIEFVREMRTILTDFLGESYAKDQCSWFWKEIGNGISNTPRAMFLFQNNLRTNIDLMITGIESLISETNYLEFLVKLANICRRHSEIHLASDIYERILTLSKAIHGSEKEAGNAMLGLATINTDQAKFKKAAVLTDKNWIQKVSELEGLLIPGLEIKAFDRDQVEEAESWLSE